jgi:hypothetical protein
MWKLAPAATPLLSRTLAQAREGTARRASSRLAGFKRRAELCQESARSIGERTPCRTLTEGRLVVQRTRVLYQPPLSPRWKCRLCLRRRRRRCWSIGR